jgi:AraC-like DNA-binding protein
LFIAMTGGSLTWMSGIAAEARSATPTLELRRFVQSYSGIRYEGFTPGVHLGLPSPHLTVVANVSGALSVAVPDRSPAPRLFRGLAAGLHTRPALVFHDGSQDAVSFELTPLGARSLLGVPAAELTGAVVELDDVLPGDAAELMDRVAAAADWSVRFAVLDDVLLRRARRTDVSEGAVERAWHRIVEAGGRLRVDELAREMGYSRRQLTKRFTGEYGVTPKQALRVVRFERSWHALRRLERRRRTSLPGKRPSLAELAVRCGYSDQSHLTREWNELAGCPPSAWLAQEELPFVQDAGSEPA